MAVVRGSSPLAQRRVKADPTGFHRSDRLSVPSLPNAAWYMLCIGYLIFRLATAIIASKAEPIQNRTTILNSC